MKLYRSHKHTTRWYAFQPGVGFLMFPAEAGGWTKRQQARGFDPIDVREVPLSLAADTGILATPGNQINDADSVFLEAA